ncbi:MAG: DUF5989 family protein [bacterium]
MQRPQSERESFVAEAERKQPSMVSELWGLMRHNKKWWLTPILVAAVLLGALMMLFGTPLSPLIYTLF